MTEELLRQVAFDPNAVLRRSYMASQRIKALDTRLQKWRETAESITASTESAPGSGFANSKVENCVIKITELQDYIREEIKFLAQAEADTTEIIEELSSKQTYKIALELRFLNNMTYEEISVQMAYTFRWTQELLKRALADLQMQAQARLSTWESNV